VLGYRSLLHAVLPGRVALLSGLPRSFRPFCGVTERAFTLPVRTGSVPAIQEADAFHVRFELLRWFVSAPERAAAG
jgi:hypothetical protein